MKRVSKVACILEISKNFGFMGILGIIAKFLILTWLTLSGCLLIPLSNDDAKTKPDNSFVPHLLTSRYNRKLSIFKDFKEISGNECCVKCHHQFCDQPDFRLNRELSDLRDFQEMYINSVFSLPVKTEVFGFKRFKEISINLTVKTGVIREIAANQIWHPYKQRWLWDWIFLGTQIPEFLGFFPK